MAIGKVNSYIIGRVSAIQFSVMAPPTEINAACRFLKDLLSGSASSGFPAATPSSHAPCRNVMSWLGPILSQMVLNLPVTDVS